MTIPFSLIRSHNMNNSIIPWEHFPFINNAIIVEQHHCKVLWRKLNSQKSCMRNDILKKLI